MALLFKHTENNRTNYLVDLGIQFNDRPVYADVTGVMRDAIYEDNKSLYGYKSGEGPFFAIEKYRNEEYADYVAQHATLDNLHRFNCRGVMFFVSGVAEQRASG